MRSVSLRSGVLDAILGKRSAVSTIELHNRPYVAGDAGHPDVQAAVHRTLGAIHAAGRVGGTLAPLGTAHDLIKSGARLLMTRVADLLAAGAAGYQQQLAAAAAANSVAGAAGTHKESR